jgi:hypothetical protein
MSSDYERIGEQIKRVTEKARELKRNDRRVSALVDSCVHYAATEYGEIDPDDASKAAYEIATFAAALLYARIYDEDGELAGLMRERDHFRDAVLKMGRLTTPQAIFVPKPA